MKIEKISDQRAGDVYRVFSSILHDSFPEYSLELKNFFLTKDFPLVSWKEKIKNQKIIVLGAIEQDKIVGVLVMDQLYGGVSYCTWLGVVKEFRGRGIGTRLIKEWEKEIAKIGGHKLMLITQEEINRSYYKKLGFTEEGFEEKSWFGLDCWKFGKVIGLPNSSVFLK